jgi:hypothetical protein
MALSNLDCDECPDHTGAGTVELYEDWDDEYVLQGKCETCKTIYYFSMTEVYRKKGKGNERSSDNHS